MNALLAYLDERDRGFSGRLAVWKPPRWFRLWMLAATRLGDGWLWLLTGTVLLVIGDTAVLGAAGIASLGANVAIVLLKKRFRRRRPASYTANTFFQVGRPDLFAFDNFSFPSGHTLNAFAIGTVLILAHPAIAPAVACVAASVGLSRVVLRMHFVTDVLVGALLGSLIGGAAWSLLIP